MPDLTAEQLAATRAAMSETLTLDPGDALTQVRVPVLAFFGEHDINVDTQRSSALYERYLAEAGNDDVTIVVLRGVGHDIDTSISEYWEALTDWLHQRFGAGTE